MNAHEANALAEARRRELTYLQVLALDYPGVAALTGARIEPNGDSPADFFWRQCREHVAGALEAEVHEANRETAREALQVRARELFPRATVTRDGRRYVVDLRGDELDGRRA